MKNFLTFIFSLLVGGHALSADDRPNILFAISDDQSWMHAGAYGLDKTIQTPAFDRIAEEGVLFNHAYSAAPSCAPSRAAILTGRHIWELEEGGILFGILKPQKFPVFTAQLREAGYALGHTGKTYGPGRIEGGNLEDVVGTAYQKHKLEVKTPGLSGTNYAANFDEFLAEHDPDKPFFFWLGTSEPHQSYNIGGWEAAGKRLKDALLPGCLPDDPVTRGEMLDYAIEIEHFDRHLGKALEALEAAGQLDNTLVVVTSDHGNPMPRSKCNLYDSGSRVPLAARLPGKIPGGRVVEDFIHLPDLGPTFLEAAGLEALDSVSGRSFWNILTSEESGWVDQTRQFAVTAFERHIICRRNGYGYPMRCIRTKDWAYIRNYEPDRWPAGDPDFNSSHQGFFGDCDRGQSKDFMLANAMKPTVRPYFLRAFGRRPAEELYDMRVDPNQLQNLAQNPKHAERLAELKGQLEVFLKEHDDPRQRGEAAWDDYPFTDQRIFKSPNWETEGLPTPLPSQ
ncbi:MAG: N-sulfoglucosamine sulfohydrolase [Verrucomicrobiales bacterium]|jgi:N-sulfoglucosamine sulfohydrolase